MKQKKQSSLARILGYAGGHRNLTLLGCILSALSAVLGLIPYVCVWLAARDVLETWPALTGVSGSARWGLDGSMDRSHKYRSVFCSAHVHSYRGLPHGPEYPARCHGARPEAAAWILHGQSVRTAQETDRRQCRSYRRSACPQAA